MSCPVHVRFKVSDGTDPMDTYFEFDPGCHRMNLRLSAFKPEQLDALVDATYAAISRRIGEQLEAAIVETKAWAQSLLAEDGGVG